MLVFTEQGIERKVIEIVAAVCKRPTETIQTGDSLMDDLGVDSIRFLEILAEVEESFGFDIDVDDLRPELFRTIRSVAHYVKGRVKLP